MRRVQYLVVTVFVLALGGLLPATSTATLPPNPNWTNSPVSGPSPNGSHTVANTDGGECPTSLSPRGLAPVVLGGNGETVRVRLRTQDNIGVIATQFYTPTNGDWGGPFPIPPNLAPGVYPLEATCADFTQQMEAGGVSSPVILGGTFGSNYAMRSYTVVAPAPSEPPDPVEAEVTFTG